VDRAPSGRSKIFSLMTQREGASLSMEYQGLNKNMGFQGQKNKDFLRLASL
jgi:hypothetical protein